MDTTEKAFDRIWSKHKLAIGLTIVVIPTLLRVISTVCFWLVLMCVGRAVLAKITLERVGSWENIALVCQISFWLAAVVIKKVALRYWLKMSEKQKYQNGGSVVSGLNERAERTQHSTAKPSVYMERLNRLAASRGVVLRPANEPTLYYAVFDAGGQGMKDAGLMGVFDTEEKAKEAIGRSWCSIKPVELNKLFSSGIQHGN